MDNTKKKVFSGFLWKYGERCGAQAIQFVVTIVLARLLSPADYGIIGLLTVFIAIANVFAQSGLGQALVQKKGADNTDFSTVFYFSLVFSAAIYAILFFTAPLIAGFYDNSELTSVVRMLGVTVIIGAVNSVQQAYVQRMMKFKYLFSATFIGAVASGAIGIGMAYAGMGVKALAAQQISMQLISCIVLWFVLKWRPLWIFSIQRMKRLFSFGWKLLCSNLLDTAYNNMYSLIIGKYYSAADLGYYNQGKQFPMLIIQNINQAIDSVLFPVFSESQDERERLKKMVRCSIMVSTFIIFPAMAGLAAVAKQLTVVILTEKWLKAVPFIQFCCFTYAFWPLQTANLQAIKAVGRSDIFLKLEIIKKFMGVTVLCVTLKHGLMVMMTARCATAMVSLCLNAYPNIKLLGYSIAEQLKDVMPSMLISLLMAGGILLIGQINLNSMLLLIIQVVVGITAYFAMARLLKLKAFEYICDMMKQVINRKAS